MKKSIVTAIFFTFITITSLPVQADDETAKALIGSVIGIIATEAMKEPTAPQETKEDIQWNSSRPEINQGSSSISSEELQRNKEIQARLTRMGFYTDEIDGVSGPATTDAIMNWETEFEQSQDGIIDDHEFYYLDELVTGGFTNKADYDRATQAGYKTRKEYLAATQQTSAIQNETIPQEDKPVKTETKESTQDKSSNPAASQTNKKEMPKILQIVIWFSVFFGFILFIALIKGVLETGSEYGLRLMLSPQFFIMLLGLPFGFFVGIGSISDSTAEVSISDLLLLLLSLSIPVLTSYIMNARVSNYVFAIPYTLVQLLSIPFCIFAIAVFKGLKDEYGSKKKYR